MKKKTNWDELPIMCWKLTLYKEDDKGNQKFYEYYYKVQYREKGSQSTS